MEIAFFFTCAGCAAIDTQRVDSLSVMNATPLSQLILQKEKWPAGWIWRRTAAGAEELFCPKCQAAGKLPPPAPAQPGRGLGAPFR